MARAPKILAFSGSLRAGSFNQTLIRIGVQGAAAAGAEVTVISLRDYPLPVFDQDIEAREVPDNALKLLELFRMHDGLLIASPEYNSSVTAALKNAIDWVSRPLNGAPGLVGFSGKVAGLMSASPGALGGLRGLVHLRAILSNIQVLVIPDQIAISQAHQAFDEQGQLKDKGQQQRVEEIGKKTAELIRKLNAV
ncbi:MAG: NAD(P)H-dependent oxidoreductase [Planctomycetales bacterium]